MKVLVDTHVLIWWLGDFPMEPEAVATLANPGNDVLVSAASVWEITIKRTLGRLRFDADVLEAVTATGFSLLGMSAEHAAVAGALPPHHQDPFDRMLVAQAQTEQLVLVTRDESIMKYNVPVLRA